MAIAIEQLKKGPDAGCGQSANTLGGISTFFTPDQMEKLNSIMVFRKIEAGHYLFWEGDETGKLYYIRSGRIKLRKSTEEGKDLILSILQKGDLLGEIAGDSTHSFSAEATEPTEIGVILEKDLENLLYCYGDFAVQFTKWMGLNQRITHSKFRDLLLYGKPGALASTLIRMSNSYGTPEKDGIRLNMKLTNAEMGDMIGTTRESVNRMLAELREAGTIDVNQGQIVIREMEGLRRICNCPSYPVCPKEVCRI